MYMYDRSRDDSTYMAQEEDIPEEPDDSEPSLQESSEFERPKLSDFDNGKSEIR